MKLFGKTVLVRVDFNVPMNDGVVADDVRIRAPITTIQNLQNHGAKIVLISHIGKSSDEGDIHSLQPLIPTIEQIYKCPVRFIDNYSIEETKNIIDQTSSRNLILLENIRRYTEEENCDLVFAKKLASLGDFFVNEAFSVSHRKHASVFGIPQFLPSDIGENFKREIQNIENFFQNTTDKKMALIGGSKLKTKVKLLKKLVTKFDKLALGGGISGAFLPYLADKSLTSFGLKEYSEEVEEIIKNAKSFGCELIVPTDFISLISTNHDHAIMMNQNSNINVFDIGFDSIESLKKHISSCDTILWNGPLGMFEHPPFEFGTKSIAEFIAERTQNHQLVSIIGGGDTGFAVKKFQVADKMTYVSTSGGAFLNYLENEDCPALEAIRISREKFSSVIF